MLSLALLAAAPPTAADIAAFDAKVTVFESLLAAARDGDAERFKATTGDGAKANIQFEDRPFAVETFRDFKDACVFERKATIAYDKYEGIHLFYQCNSLGIERLVFNVWIKDGKVRYVGASVPPSFPGGG